MAGASPQAEPVSYLTFPNEVEAVFQVPPEPKGTVLIAHGCAHDAKQFFSQAPGCPTCSYLPEESKIVQQILDAKYAVIALSSEDEAFRCWNYEIDAPRVQEAMQSFFGERVALRRLPLAAMGFSSGGAFVLRLAEILPVRAVISQIMAIPPKQLPRPSPPVFFIHMERDKQIAALGEKCVRKLKKNGTLAIQILAPPIPLNESFFARRIRSMNAATSTAIYNALKPMLDENHFLIKDPRVSRWRPALRKKPKLMKALPGIRDGVWDTLEPDVSPISEVLNVAYGMHELTSDFMAQTVHFLDSTML